jgi:hypothetical protein
MAGCCHALQIDASSDEIHTRMGRGLTNELRAGQSSRHLGSGLEGLWERARELGYRLKLNTLVCK